MELVEGLLDGRLPPRRAPLALLLPADLSHQFLAGRRGHRRSGRRVPALEKEIQGGET